MDQNGLFSFSNADSGNEYTDLMYKDVGNNHIEDHHRIGPGSTHNYSGDGDENTATVDVEHQTKSKVAHQCHICNKTFVSFKGLQQHSVVHTGQKPFVCDICNKSFRFKSNLFEHRSVHSGTSPHACPYCGKTCRLKGNLKKHLKTHVNSKEELDVAWMPFASNRRPPAEVPQDAIIIRSRIENSLYNSNNRQRKRKYGLGTESKFWVEKIQNGEIMPMVSVSEAMEKIINLPQINEHTSFIDLLNKSRSLPFERFDCPPCKSAFFTRSECSDHIKREHMPSFRQNPLFCQICMKSFSDKKSRTQHEAFHQRVRAMLREGQINFGEPKIVVPTRIKRTAPLLSNSE